MYFQTFGGGTVRQMLGDKEGVLKFSEMFETDSIFTGLTARQILLPTF